MKLATNRTNTASTRRPLLPALALVAFSLVAGQLEAAQPAAPALPFKAEVAGTVSVGTTAITLQGRGTGSLLGRFSDQGNGHFTSSSSNTLTETLTTADGDTITLLCVETTEDLGDGILHGTDSWTVTAGTGRFKGATGSGTADTYVHNLATFIKQFNGAISIK